MLPCCKCHSLSGEAGGNPTGEHGSKDKALLAALLLMRTVIRQTPSQPLGIATGFMQSHTVTQTHSCLYRHTHTHTGMHPHTHTCNGHLTCDLTLSLTSLLYVRYLDPLTATGAKETTNHRTVHLTPNKEWAGNPLTVHLTPNKEWAGNPLTGHLTPNEEWVGCHSRCLLMRWTYKDNCLYQHLDR